jgi:hypothetical protein
MEDVEVNVTIALISGVHRSLFHPLATVRHRTWAGPETKEKRVKQNNFHKINGKHKLELTK